MGLGQTLTHTNYYAKSIISEGIQMINSLRLQWQRSLEGWVIFNTNNSSSLQYEGHGFVLCNHVRVYFRDRQIYVLNKIDIQLEALSIVADLLFALDLGLGCFQIETDFSILYDVFVRVRDLPPCIRLIAMHIKQLI